MWKNRRYFINLSGECNLTIVAPVRCCKTPIDGCLSLRPLYCILCANLCVLCGLIDHKKHKGKNVRLLTCCGITQHPRTVGACYHKQSVLYYYHNLKHRSGLCRTDCISSTLTNSIESLRRR